MPFWGGGKSEQQPAAKDFTSDDDARFSDGGASVPMSSYGGGGGGGSAVAELQQFAMAIQQQTIIQNTITQLSDRAFEKCITAKPSDSLSGKEAACVQSSVLKWLDTSQFMMRRLEKKQSSGQ